MRSLLFVPADSPKKLAKALGSGADALIVDLEDSVAPAARPAARANAVAFLREQAGRDGVPRLVVRINPLSSDDWRADLAAVMPAAPASIMLPKPASGADVTRLAGELDIRENDLGLPPGATRVIAIATEVPAALLAMQSFIGASPRLEALTWGTEDLSAAIGAARARENGAHTSPFRLARDLTLFAAAAAGIAAIDEIEADFRNAAGLEAAARAAARDGFSGKMAIHPDQVAVINAAFTPSAAEVTEARDIVALFAAQPNAGTLAYGSRMVDRPHLVRAERLLARARLAGI